MPSPNRFTWTAEKVLGLGRSYQASAVLAAAADLELFDALAGRSRTVSEVSRSLRCRSRGLTVLLDALSSLALVRKSGHRYSLPPELQELLTAAGPKTILGMAQHQANCLRRWSELARVVKTGRPAKVPPSVRGVTGDQGAFIEAMHNISAPVARRVISALRPLKFSHLLDVGGASGTWTIAFLQTCPEARATLFDLPPVLELARRRLTTARLIHRVELVAGDFLKDPLPEGADLAWVSAIVHQNSRLQNRTLFTKIHRALQPGGRVALRDVLMEKDRTRPVAGALFAVNMLVATEGGGTYSCEELSQDLKHAGFGKAALARKDDSMNSILVAKRRR